MPASNNTEARSLRRVAKRWGVLKCLNEVLCNSRLDMPNSIKNDLETAKTMIEKNPEKARNINELLNWIEIKLSEKAISLSNVAYWEASLKKAKEDNLTREEATKVPFMRTLIGQHTFLSHHIPIETETPRDKRQR